ncbi:hypothetical protein MUK42_34529 [Musa troglodytarum]|uniref:Uncharacterized protein n=1 Tax=Musa troglodytarum TaxID=320322 RepID=A0A9E7F2M3_9LILI|nr:hypothetical protein MUK42_34529 [Musa troglodytarum]
MFFAVAGGRRKGVAFEAAEPSSPKVTCIAQVLVKGKKKAKATAWGSRWVGSFRRVENVGGVPECFPIKYQRWVHQLSVNICQVVRAFRYEFNCFSPCGPRFLCSYSSSRSREQGQEESGVKRSSSCGAMFTRCLMEVPGIKAGNSREVMGVVFQGKGDREMGMVIEGGIKRELGVVGGDGEERRGGDDGGERTRGGMLCYAFPRGMLCC